MSNQKGLAPILIVIIIAVLVGGYFVYTNYSNNQTKTGSQNSVVNSQTPQPSSTGTQTSSSKPLDVIESCYPTSCWISVKDSVGKVGFGLIEAYYTIYKQEDSETKKVLDCPGLVLDKSYDENNKNLVAHRPNDNIVHLNIDSIDPRFKQMILDSTERHPLLLDIVQTHDAGRGWDDKCGYSDYQIYGARLAR